VRLTVALPTRDRRDLALGALEALVPQLRPGDELIVVDNGSSDGTGEAVLAWLSRRFPAGRLLEVAERSLSLSRNAALAAASTPVVCFIDDDERPQPDWLETLRSAWAGAGPQVAAIGGPKRIVWEAPRPPWLRDDLLYVVNGADRGAERRTLDQTPGRGYLSGGNLSLRRSAGLAVGGFEPDRAYLDALRRRDPRHRPRLPTARSGEEEDLQRRLAAAGWEVLFEPEAVVRHLVPAERLTESFFRDFFHQRGVLHAAVGRRGRAAALRHLARASVRFAALALLARPDARAATFDWVYGWALLSGPRSRAGSENSAHPPDVSRPVDHRPG
jgi:glycosyltransferase involved in cell wall biosynthesis